MALYTDNSNLAAEIEALAERRPDLWSLSGDRGHPVRDRSPGLAGPGRVCQGGSAGPGCCSYRACRAGLRILALRSMY